MYLSVCLSVCVWLCSPLLDLGQFFSFLILFTVGRTPCTGDQPVARPLRTHRTTQHKINTDINELSGVQTHDPSVRGNEENAFLRARSHCDRRFMVLEQDIYQLEYLVTYCVKEDCLWSKASALIFI
jgi:hypothetical protein